MTTYSVGDEVKDVTDTGAPPRESAQRMDAGPVLLTLARQKARAGLAILLVLGLPILLFAPILDRIDQFLGPLGDFPVHARYAQQWAEQGILRTPHFLNAILTMAVKQAIPKLDYQAAELVVAQLMYVLASASLYGVLCWIAPGFAARRPIWLALASTSLLLVGPVTIFTIFNQNLYKGYLPPANVYHNPTILVLKPLALASFGVFVYFLEGSSLSAAATWGCSIVLALTTALATLAKPNYTMCIVPAGLLLVVIDPQFRRSSRAWLAALVVAGTGGAVLFWQYELTYAMASQTGLVFRPFYISALQDPGGRGWLKFFASIAFPGCVAVVFFARARYSTALRLAWIGFAVACCFHYSLIEEGYRAGHQNFGWGCQVMLFILFTFSLGLLLGEMSSGYRPGTAVCWLIYGMHLASGVIFYQSARMGLGGLWW
jgi:hypothetical protein